MIRDLRKIRTFLKKFTYRKMGKTKYIPTFVIYDEVIVKVEKIVSVNVILEGI